MSPNIGTRLSGIRATNAERHVSVLVPLDIRLPSSRERSLVPGSPWTDLGGVVAEIGDQRVGRGVDSIHLATLRQRHSSGAYRMQRWFSASSWNCQRSSERSLVTVPSSGWSSSVQRMNTWGTV